MVVITEITSRDIRTVSGIWAIEPDGSCAFITNTHNAVKRVSIRDGEKVAVVRELIRESYGSEYVGRDLHMSYQWTDWMGNPPVAIKTDEAMSVYMNMSSQVADMSLLVSLVNVEDLISGEESSNTSTVDETASLVSHELLTTGLATEEANGATDNPFSILPAYLQGLGESNPGSLIELKTVVDGNGLSVFKYLFVAFAASLEGFANIRRVIVIDGTQLKGKYGGCLLTGSCEDANSQVFPLPFAIVHSENDDAWEWFFRELSRAIPDTTNLSFVSDRHSSIYRGLRRVYPKARHGACVVHLRKEIVSTFTEKQLGLHVSRAATAYRLTDFHSHFNEVVMLDPSCARYLDLIGFCHWARAYFEGDRYNVMTTNVAESLNVVLKEACALPIISLLEFIRTTLMTWFAERRKAASNETSAILPNMRAVMHKNFEKSRSFFVKRIDRFDYDVRGEGSGVFHVNLLKCACTCREFNLLHHPCPHALAAAVSEGVPILGLMAPEYSVESWRMSYAGTIQPMPDVGAVFPLPEPIASIQLQPPSTSRPPGRPSSNMPE